MKTLTIVLACVALALQLNGDESRLVWAAAFWCGLVTLGE